MFIVIFNSMIVRRAWSGRYHHGVIEIGCVIVTGSGNCGERLSASPFLIEKQILS